MTILDQSEPILALRAASCLVTTSTVLPASRSSSDSPQHQMTLMPLSVAYLVLEETTSSDSLRIVRRSLWPRMAQVAPVSLSCSTEISPV